MTKTLSPEQVKSYYDAFGKKQDSQGYYENKPIDIIVEEAAFKEASNIFELGCGTGKRAKELFKNTLNSTCEYTGQDISETMVVLSKENLDPWKERTSVRLSDGSMTLPDEDGTYDRVLSTYVLDLLPDEKIKEVLHEARRILKKNGQLCLVGITTGTNIRSKIVSTVWNIVFKLRPRTVGGCRPLNLTTYIVKSEWEIIYHRKVTAKLIPSEILIATPKKE